MATRSRGSFTAVAAALCSTLLAFEASAQCVNTAQTSCQVYEACFAHYCDCSRSPDEYMLTYGKAYCERFLGNTNFSADGKAWRDSTLRCLQEAIVPELNIVEPPQSCNCGTMRQKAFDSHVACYTQPTHSICDLPLGDIEEIRETVKLKDAFSSEGWETMKAITQRCGDTAKDATRQAIWGSIADLLK